ncbi:MAG TPA: HemK family protein methyltransferase, partial [Alphaproteobacteria bacterium]
MIESATLPTVGAALARCRTALAEAGIESAALDARLLVAEALSVPVERVIAWPERDVAADAATRLDTLLRRRLAREPMSQILGRREFWSLEFQVTRDVLTPRPDSETIVAAVLEQIADRSRALSVLDLGVGTGCLLLALLKELPFATGIGVDRSAAALAVAQRNARRLDLQGRVRWVHGN